MNAFSSGAFATQGAFGGRSAFGVSVESDPIANIPGLVLRYQSWNPETFLNPDGNPATDSEEVETILDLSGQGNSVPQTTPSFRGLWTDAGPNGHGALWYDDVDDGAETGLVLTDEYTLVLAASTFAFAQTRCLQSNSANRVMSTSRGNEAVYIDGVVFNDASLFTGEWTMMIVRGNASETNVRVNGVDVTGNPAFVGAWGGLGIGAAGTATLEVFDGLFAAAIAFSRPLNLSEVIVVEQYISEKTGITI